MKNLVVFLTLALLGYVTSYPVHQTYYEDGTPAFVLGPHNDEEYSSLWGEERAMVLPLWPTSHRPASEQLGPPKNYWFGGPTKSRTSVSEFTYPGHIIEDKGVKQRKYKVVKKKKNNNKTTGKVEEEDDEESSEESSEEEEEEADDVEEHDEEESGSASEESEEAEDDFGMDTPSFNQLFPKRRPDGTYSGNIVGPNDDSTFASRSGMAAPYNYYSSEVSSESTEDDFVPPPRSIRPIWRPYEREPYPYSDFISRPRSDIYGSVEEYESSSEESSEDLGRFIRVQSKWPYNRKYNPDYVVNPTLMAKRWRRRPPYQKVQFLKGTWGLNPREGWMHPITGAEWTH